MNEPRLSAYEPWSVGESAAPQPAPPASEAAAAPPAAGGAVSAPDLAAHLAARMCHDFISPASAIVSGLDLLEDPSAQDMRADAMNLIETSARKLAALLEFGRVAFGASASAETFETGQLERLIRGVFDHVRPDLDWAVSLPTLNKPAARALLNLAQIGATALPTGGVARITAEEQDGAVRLKVEAQGPRVRLRPEMITGLNGEPLVEGLGGQWVQAYYLHALVKAAGGSLEHEVAEDRAVLGARIPL